MPSQKIELTPEQLAKQEERARKKTERAKAGPVAVAIDNEKGRIIQRPWLKVQEAQGKGETVKIMTWNLLAQTLVRRELFPTSDCLKAHQRENMIYQEILSSGADILCMQEVDRLEKLKPFLAQAGYEHTYAAGPQKKHGCLIAFRKALFTQTGARTVIYDNEDVREEGEERTRRGSSFRTKNIGSIVALKKTGTEDFGIVIATTHLFWHPKYIYERSRQTGILQREVIKFRDQNGHVNWPCVFAGDFNFQPTEAAYSLLRGLPLLSSHETGLSDSRVVHVSIDPTVPITTPKATEDEEGEGSTTADTDKVIKNARVAMKSDGLLSSEELTALYETIRYPKSAYDEGQRLLFEASNPDVLRCGDRLQIPKDHQGAFEPEWTNYTFYWQLSLDYIFIIDPPNRSSSVLSLLKPHKKDDIHPGLPKMGVCGSDHISLAAEIQWSIDDC
ncbi:Endonuclease/exonuclease/phosphatase [Stereum hirsutum FP-91666 SS1]|uniref:Endonuclease/exonuclease/phosphatase n=1 Tax=Stereum hirsutum (strain FP-91666) TaxID=721885 RepID=UPI00044104D4|nr:Endonuclease/exonuclease/phosphatase [Stereum hirsutum FP-91666 SS1]EIM92169.1 Endonuclease/exonuclease/phosphatase [Stereum hirsutum FP-91666 SS1]